MLHYMRIAVTALSLTAFVLLIALWVRSYRLSDGFEGALHGWLVEGESTQGQLRASAWHSGYAGDWRVDAYDVEGFTVMPRRLDFGYWGDGAGVWAPHWFLVLVTTIVATAAWLRSCTRFGLRTLLIATTLVAVMLGIVVVVR